ncbi:MAG: class I tRNA ligase family protein, partial [bacterium]
YTHTISSILFNQAPFKNVVTTGTILAEDGQKMSKSKNNFPDPWILFNKYGVDALRFYLMSCPVMKGEDINFLEKAVQDISSKIINRLNNVVAFYELYPQELEEINNNIPKTGNVLNYWIISRLGELIAETTSGMESYDMALATRPIESFIEDLSTWYLRRSRDAIKEGDKETKEVLYFILKTIAILMAPFTPFISESIWQKLKIDNDRESVHLVDWPETLGVNEEIIEKMAEVRRIVSLGLEARQKAGIKVRQPLGALIIKKYELEKEYTQIIRDELNIKVVMTDPNLAEEVSLNTEMTEELIQEGNYRELVRAIQDIRKKEGLTPSDPIILSLETNELGKEIIEKFEAEIKKTVLASEIKLEQNSGLPAQEGEEIKINDLVFKITIQK